MPVYIYTKLQKNVNFCIYKNPDTLQKARQFPLHCYIKKQDTLRSEFKKKLSWHLYTKSMTLLVT